MGSFANSLHVRTEDTGSVADEIRKILKNRGFQVTHDPPRLDAEDPGSSVRTLRVAEARDGWVGILDSDLMGLLSLAQELSSRLQTHAICVMVNDSASWHYELFHKGREVDGFDSPGSSPLLDLTELPDDMLEMPDADELAEAMEAVMDQMPALAELLQSLLPPEMREIHQKITNGTASAEEADEFSRWSRELAEGAATEFDEATRKNTDADLPVAAADSDGNGQAATKQQLEGHLHHLRPLLASGVKPDRIREILVEKAAFAEEPMADFLEMLGVSRFFARLSFQYLQEFTPEEIQSEGIGFQAPLIFVKED
jgi:hypothetical protein